MIDDEIKWVATHMIICASDYITTRVPVMLYAGMLFTRHQWNPGVQSRWKLAGGHVVWGDGTGYLTRNNYYLIRIR
jgi:hypothetical protein